MEDIKYEDSKLNETELNIDPFNEKDEKRQWVRQFVAGKQENYEKADVYEEKFRKIDQGRISWNWCGFLVPGCWLLYRKLYSWFFILLGVSTVTAFIEFYLGKGVLMDNILVQNIISYGVGFIFMILIGLFGDKLYKNKVDKCYENNVDISKGGTSLAALLIYIGVCALAVIAVAALFVTAYMMLGGEELLYL